jgi:hypothetical protein
MTTPKDRRRTIRANYLQPAFLICASMLVITASAMSVVVKLAGIYLKKEPLLLKKPLNRLDNSKLTPYKLVTKKEINNPDILETLGTEDYLQWVLENTSAPADSNSRFCTLFITYYALPDNVPHVPEECYIGGGFQRISSDVVTLKIITSKQGMSHEQQITARYLVFGETTQQMWGNETSFPVLYTISVNGEYTGEREDARIILNRNLFGKFSYSSKVEWNFYNKSFGQVVYPNKQEALAASEKLLAVILPLLEKEHWPSGLW